MKPTPEIFPDREALSTALAARVAVLAAEAVSARGRFLLAIPGGSAVSLLARGLARAPIDAPAWELFWTDERGLPRNDPQSNFLLAKAELLPFLRIPDGHLHPADGSLGPDAGACAYEADLAQAFGIAPGDLPRFDLVLLGIGEDGHVASLFPSHPALLERRRWVSPVRHAPKPPPDRITLTLPVLRRARHVLVAAAGAGKADILARALAPSGGSPVLPAQRLHPLDGDLRWMIDRAAAAHLEKSP